MMISLHIVCDRCKQVVKDAGKECGGCTAGYYEVQHGSWRKYANAGEVYVCDACMHIDPRYKNDYPL
ncbi:MAG: hypothetical protein Q7U76_12945 [Nitrospirota bacterium]|nr:hypothetical protein [Nitrospirota bacterium]